MPACCPCWPPGPQPWCGAPAAAGCQKLPPAGAAAGGGAAAGALAPAQPPPRLCHAPAFACCWAGAGGGWPCRCARAWRSSASSAARSCTDGSVGASSMPRSLHGEPLRPTTKLGIRRAPAPRPSPSLIVGDSCLMPEAKQARGGACRPCQRRWCGGGPAGPFVPLDGAQRAYIRLRLQGWVGSPPEKCSQRCLLR